MRHLDLFAGIGGFALAARWMGWETIAQVEWDKWCQKILAKNFTDAIRFGDIKEFNEMLRDGRIITDTEGMGCRERTTEQGEYGNGKSSNQFSNICETQSINIGRIDILTGGFPCQPFSHAGKRKGIDDSRYLWPEMLESIRILKPPFVIGENVAGLVSMENGKTLDRILSDMADEGYTTEQFIIPACALGAWHRRDRIWIIAYNANSGIENLRRRENTIYEYVPNPCSMGRKPRTIIRGTIQKESRRTKSNIGNNASDVSYTQNERFQAGGKCNIPERQIRTSRDDDNKREQWITEPSVGRVANGIPNRVDRLKGLGNAIVPQVAFEIFKAIEQYETLSQTS